MANASDQFYSCAFCSSKNLSIVMDFGAMGLAGGFLERSALASEVKYNMNLGFCMDCCAVQILDQINPDTMFRSGYFYFSSSIRTLQDHFHAYARDVVNRFIADPVNSCVLEFGCNDGVLLRPLADLDIGTLIGVDPAQNVVARINDDRITVVNSYFDVACADEVVTKYGAVDLILANNVFAHVRDINGLTKAVDLALAADGVFIFEVHYLGKIIEEIQYDMIYHEHIYYYSLVALENHFSRYGMMVFDLKHISNHGGSIRFHVCRTSSKYAVESEAVRKLREEEFKKGYHSVEAFNAFGQTIKSQKSEFVSLLSDLKNAGNSIVGYGASGRANTMLQFCNLDENTLDYMVDDAPAKTGFYTPGSHLQIRSEIPLGDDRPDFVVIFAWTFLKEIYRRNIHYLTLGGRFIVPLPKVEIVDLEKLKNMFPEL